MQALQYTQAHRDNGASHSMAEQAKNVQRARQQLLLNANSSSPNLATPSWRAQERNPTVLRPGLGFALASDSAAAVASSNTEVLQLPSSSNAASAPSTAMASAAAAEACTQSAQNQQEIASAKGTQMGQARVSDTMTAVKQFGGALYVTGSKGEELICELKTDSWPAHLAR